MMPRHNLPPRDYERFVGRQSELAELRRLLGSRSRAFVVTIDGIGGIGKSALALEAAYSLCDFYATLPEVERFEAIVWVSAKRSYLTADGILERRQSFQTLADLYAAIAQVLAFPAITRVPAEEQQTLVEQVLSEQRTLLILDNLETVDDEDLMVFLRELPSPAKAIVTTRHRIDVAYPVRLTGMQHEDALALIIQEAARKDVILSPDQQEDLWMRTGGVPLAIVWSIGLMGLGGSIESVLHRLGSGQSDIARFCFAENVAQIQGRDAYRLLLALSLFASDASREALGVVAGLGEDLFGRDVGMEDLLRLSLVNKEGDRFSFLPLTRVFAQAEVARDEAWLSQAYQRMFEYFLQLVQVHGGRGQGVESYSIIERDLPNILFIIKYISDTLPYLERDNGSQYLDPAFTQQADRLVLLMTIMERTCRYLGYWTDCVNLCVDALAIGRQTNNTLRNARHCFELSRLHYYWGNYRVARKWAEEALAEAEQGGHEEYILQANRRIGLVALKLGDIATAKRILSETFARAQRVKERINIAPYIAALGEVAIVRSDLATAQAQYERAIDVSRQRNDLPPLSADLIKLGQVYISANNMARAEECLLEGLQIARENAAVDLAGTALFHLGVLDAHLGRRASAIGRLQQTLVLFRRLGIKREQAEAEALLRQLGEQL